MTRATEDRLLPDDLPQAWRSGLAAQLQPGEAVQVWLQTDLDDTLHFATNLLVLTDRRLLACAGEQWRNWPLAAGQHFQHHDHAGVGTLALHDAACRLGSWRYTLALNTEALRLADQHTRQIERLAHPDHVVEDEDGLCPRCKAPLPPDDDECPLCERSTTRPPSTWALLRLWRFARPYRGRLFAGFLLTLASTAANLVPPYLTIPLMDKVLIPHQTGTPITVAAVWPYLAGLLGAALLGWALGWARTYILARVSERIGADLRTTTFDHLMGQSLEYFGGKRTGDLMARIGAETDRINVFLSLHLLDFATDVLMLFMTAVVLFSINPWLALVTLLPLPVIAWMIHTVRDRLRTGFEKVDRIWGEVTNVLADTIPGIRVVKAFAQEKRESARFA
ncbi:MAG: ABC transporter transmembrane domain-containing protein, partial [Pseudomonadota bacterium]